MLRDAEPMWRSNAQPSEIETRFVARTSAEASHPKRTTWTTCGAIFSGIASVCGSSALTFSVPEVGNCCASSPLAAATAAKSGKFSMCAGATLVITPILGLATTASELISFA